MNERRQARRVEPRRPIRAKVKASVPARVVDISSGGAQIEVISSLRPHVACEIRFQVGEREVVVNSTVRRCRAWGFGFDDRDRKVLLYRAGVEFEEVDSEVLEVLREELASQGLGSGVHAAVSAEDEGSPSTSDDGEERGDAQSAAAKETAKVQAPRRDGPLKIRIRADHVREILDKPKK